MQENINVIKGSSNVPERDGQIMAHELHPYG